MGQSLPDFKVLIVCAGSRLTQPSPRGSASTPEDVDGSSLDHDGSPLGMRGYSESGKYRSGLCTTRSGLIHCGHLSNVIGEILPMVGPDFIR